MLPSFLFATSALAYSQCNVGNTNGFAVGQTATLVPSATRSVNGAPVTVSGSISVVNGCTFRLNNVVITGGNGLTDVSIYAGKAGDNPNNGINLTNTLLKGNGVVNSGDVPFIQTPGNWVSYADFNEFRIFDTKTQSLIAIGSLIAPAPLPVQPPSSDASYDDPYYPSDNYGYDVYYYPTQTFTRTRTPRPRPTTDTYVPPPHVPTGSLTQPTTHATTTSTPKPEPPKPTTPTTPKATPSVNLGDATTPASFISAIGALLWAIAL